MATTNEYTPDPMILEEERRWDAPPLPKLPTAAIRDAATRRLLELLTDDDDGAWDGDDDRPATKDEARRLVAELKARGKPVVLRSRYSMDGMEGYAASGWCIYRLRVGSRLVGVWRCAWSSEATPGGGWSTTTTDPRGMNVVDEQRIGEVEIEELSSGWPSSWDEANEME